MQMLFESVRPRTWDDVIGHKQVITAIARMREKGTLGGRAFWINGPSGVGKTTLAYLIAGDVCCEDNFVELDAGMVTPARLDALETSLRCRALDIKTGRAVLLNEAHGLRQDTVRQLLVVLERIPNHVTWVFTTTNAGQQRLFDGIDANPLLSRCIQFKLRQYPERFAEYAKRIAEENGLGGASMIDYLDLVKRCEGNLRMVLSEIETGCCIREELVCA